MALLLTVVTGFSLVQLRLQSAHVMVVEEVAECHEQEAECRCHFSESVDITDHWRHQLWGTGAHAPLDFQLVFVIDVGAQSTLGEDIFAQKYMHEN